MARAIVLTLLATALVAGFSRQQTTASKSSASKASNSKASKTHLKPGATATSRTAAHKTSTKSVKSASAKTNARGRKRRRSARVAAVPSFQLHPDPERYRQIQQALADRGYFKGQVNGEWNDDSVDALKRFQTDQKLENDGKINALSLTALGLGPKHDGSTAGTVPLSATNPAGPENPPAWRHHN